MHILIYKIPKTILKIFSEIAKRRGKYNYFINLLDSISFRFVAHNQLKIFQKEEVNTLVVNQEHDDGARSNKSTH